MKKLIGAALVVGSMLAIAEESVKSEDAAKSAAAPAAEIVQAAAKRPQLTPEQRARMRERHQKLMAERKAKLETAMLEIVKKYVADEEQAKALLAELQAAMTSSRRSRARRPQPAEAKPAEVK